MSKHQPQMDGGHCPDDLDCARDYHGIGGADTGDCCECCGVVVTGFEPVADEFIAQLDPAQRERLERLRDDTSDRPAHWQYLHALLDADLHGALPNPPSGVSGRYAGALADDVWWIRDSAPAAGYRSAYPNAYAARRVTDARAAAKRRRHGPLSGLLSLGPNRESDR